MKRDKVGFIEATGSERTREGYAARRAAEVAGVQDQMLAEMRTRSEALVTLIQEQRRTNQLLEWLGQPR